MRSITIDLYIGLGLPLNSCGTEGLILIEPKKSSTMC